MDILNQCTTLCVQIQTRRRSSTTILATPCMPGRRASVSSSTGRPSTRKKLRPSWAVEIGVIFSTLKEKPDGRAKHKFAGRGGFDNVALVDLEDDPVGVERCHLEQHVATLHGRAQLLAEVA